MSRAHETEKHSCLAIQARENAKRGVESSGFKDGASPPGGPGSSSGQSARQCNKGACTYMDESASPPARFGRNHGAKTENGLKTDGSGILFLLLIKG